MKTRATSDRAGLSRRRFLAAAGAGAVLPIVLDACSSGGSSGSSSGGGKSGTISFWDGEVGTGQLNTEAKKLTQAYKDGNIKGSYNLMTG